MGEVVQAVDQDTSRPSPQTDAPAAARRVVTVRALLVALAVSVLAAVICHYHDGNILGTVAGQTWRPSVTMQNYIPPLVVGLMFVFLLAGNSLLYRIHRRLALSTGELALAMALSLIVSPLPRYVVHSQVGTIGYTNAMLDAKRSGMKDIIKANPYAVLPEQALLGVEDSKAFDGTLPGYRSGELVDLRAIPWSVWRTPALFWAPLVGVFLVFSISLGYMLYRQWAYRELLPFPLAEFCASLVVRDRQRALPDIFYNKLFWIGVGLMVVIFSAKGVAVSLNVQQMIYIKNKFDYTVLAYRLPFLANAGQEGYSLLRGTVYFTVVAVAFLLPSEIGLTAWFTWPLMVIGMYLYYTQTGMRFNDGHTSMMLTGCWWGMAILIVYAGRWYFWNLFKAAFGGLRATSIDAQSVWVARVWLASLAGLVALLNLVYGLALDIAVLWTLALLACFLVICRLVTAMGVPWIGMDLGPQTMLVSALGIQGLGAKIFSQLAIFERFLIPVQGGSVLPLTPAVANAAHVESKLTGGRNPSLKVIVPFLLVMLAVSVVVVIWLGYSHDGKYDDVSAPLVWRQGPMLDGYFRQTGQSPATGVAAAMRQAVNRPMSFTQRWSAAGPSADFPVLFGVGLMLVLVTGYLQIKLPRFPFHPLPLVLLGTWLMSRYWWSFLIGWGLKRITLKIGGYKLFEQFRPFYTGIVVGMGVTVLIWTGIHIVAFRSGDTGSARSWVWFLREIFSGG